MFYTIDERYRITDVVEDYESLIWTERFNGYGEFEIVAAVTPEMINNLRPEQLLIIPESTRVMEVEKVVMSRGLMTVSGRSIEAWLLRRIIYGGYVLQGWDLWDAYGPVKYMAENAFKRVCVDGATVPIEKLSLTDAPEDQIIMGTFYPPDNIAEPTHEMRGLPLRNLYDTIYDLCGAHGMGFRLVRNPETARLHFDVYMGHDLTSGVGAILLSSDNESFESENEVIDITDYANMVYYRMTPGNGRRLGDPSLRGPALRIAYKDIEPEFQDSWNATERTAYMEGQAPQLLAERRRKQAFDGVSRPDFPYKYDEDYFVGDLVMAEAVSGENYRMRITEVITIKDQLGDRTYPTVESEQFITAGTWRDSRYNIPWSSADPLGTWGTQPE